MDRQPLELARPVDVRMSPERPTEGGWESCLSEQPVDDDCLCLICYDVLRDPTIGCPNGHAACRECYEEHLASLAGSRCPAGCGVKISQETLAPNTELAERIGALPAHCSHVSKCKWTGPFGDLRDHLQTACAQEPVLCPWWAMGCREVVKRGELAAHLSGDSARHMELAGASMAGMASTVASIQSTVASLQARAEVGRLLAEARLPRLLQLADAQGMPIFCLLDPPTGRSSHPVPLTRSG